MGGALSASEAKRYTATATLQVQSPQQQQTVSGVLPGQNAQPAQISAQLAQIATRHQVLQRAKRTLHLKESTDQISADVSVSTDPVSSLVTVSGEASTAGRAVDSQTASRVHWHR